MTRQCEMRYETYVTAAVLFCGAHPETIGKVIDEMLPILHPCSCQCKVQLIVPPCEVILYLLVTGFVTMLQLANPKSIVSTLKVQCLLHRVFRDKPVALQWLNQSFFNSIVKEDQLNAAVFHLTNSCVRRTLLQCVLTGSAGSELHNDFLRELRRSLMYHGMYDMRAAYQFITTSKSLALTNDIIRAEGDQYRKMYDMAAATLGELFPYGKLLEHPCLDMLDLLEFPHLRLAAHYWDELTAMDMTRQTGRADPYMPLNEEYIKRLARICPRPTSDLTSIPARRARAASGPSSN